ncbi:MAG: recombinase family protein [Sporomusaceae bacterium]|nr:recombinase family protein [Sporomusaceae bacterium]
MEEARGLVRRMAAYCRVSTEKEDQLMSLQMQRDFFTEYAQKEGMKLVEVYADEGISGTKLKNRKDFRRLMYDAQQQKFDCVYVKDVSRMARNVVDFLQSIRKLKALNIDCRFVTANMSSNDGELTLTILAAVAQEESANLSKRVKFGKKRNAARGRVPNLVYGYDKTCGQYFDLTINTYEAQVVKRIFHYYVYERQGTYKIAQRLNQEGVLTKRQCRWSQQAISTILTNPLYIGKVINGKESIKDFLTGKRIKNEVDKQYIVDKPALAIIEQDMFDKAQALLAERTAMFRLTKTRQSNKYCFSTLIHCSDCGYSFRRIYRKWLKEYVRWGCGGRNVNGKEFCHNHTTIDERELLAAIKNYLSRLISSPDKLLKQTLAEFNKKYKPSTQDVSHDFIMSELTRLKKAKAKQRQMFEVDAISLEELKGRTAELNTAIAVYEEKLTSMKDNTAGLSSVEIKIKNYCSSIQSLLAADLFDNAMLKNLIDKIVVTVEGEIQVFLKLFSELQISQ